MRFFTSNQYLSHPKLPLIQKPSILPNSHPQPTNQPHPHPHQIPSGSNQAKPAASSNLQHIPKPAATKAFRIPRPLQPINSINKRNRGEEDSYSINTIHWMVVGGFNTKKLDIYTFLFLSLHHQRNPGIKLFTSPSPIQSKTPTLYTYPIPNTQK